MWAAVIKIGIRVILIWYDRTIQIWKSQHIWYHALVIGVDLPYNMHRLYQGLISLSLHKTHCECGYEHYNIIYIVSSFKLA